MHLLKFFFFFRETGGILDDFIDRFLGFEQFWGLFSKFSKICDYIKEVHFPRLQIQGYGFESFVSRQEHSCLYVLLTCIEAIIL